MSQTYNIKRINQLDVRVQLPKTKRKAFIYIKYQDVDGKSQEYFANGVTAVCIQHEIDHLNGVLLSDHGPLYKVK